jgi:glycosyltransferase involved in cell wall biosynthesis
MGGGSQTHLNSLVRALAGKANCLVGYGEPNGELQLSVASDKPGFGLVFRIPDHLPDLVRILHKLRVSRVDVHQTVGFETQIEMVLDALAVPFDITLLDYHLIANNPFLCLDDGRFVGDKRLRNLEFKLLRRTPLPILRKASRVIAISRDLAARVDQLCPGLPMIPARLWHDTQARVRHVFAPRLWGNEPLRVVIAGSIEPHKGQAILTEVARIIAVRRLPIRLHLIGEIRLPRHILQDMEEALTIHGRYEAGKFAETLGSIAPHVAWLPSQVPETWSYVVTDFMDASLPITATAIGAIPERCYGRPYTWLLPLDATAADWVELFLRLHATGLKEPPRWVDIDHLPPTRPIYFEEYLHPGAAPALKT